MKKQVALSVFTMAVMLWGCGASTSAPRTADNQRIEIRVLFESGAAGKGTAGRRVATEATEVERKELTTWMEQDLISVLNERGYAASALKSLDEYNPGPQTCLLSMVLESYIPANRVSQLEAGLGEGSVTVDIHYDLFVGQGTAQRRLFSNDRGRTSARNWQWIAGELNKTIAADVTKRLRKVLK